MTLLISVSFGFWDIESFPLFIALDYPLLIEVKFRFQLVFYII